MIIPEPRDLPPKAAAEARILTNDVQELNKDARFIADQSIVKFNYTNVTLQNLGQQIVKAQTLVNSLPGDDNLSSSQVTNFVVNTTYTTLTSFVVNVPAGYSQASMVIIGTGILNDPTTPYATTANVRIGVNGAYAQAMATSTATAAAVGVSRTFHLSATETVFGTGPITISIQAIADQTIQASTSTFCRLTAFTLFSQ